METVIKPFSAFPSLTDSIKRAIGLSLWNLYSTREHVNGASFLLQTEGQQYLLDEDGDVIREVGEKEKIDRSGRVMFEGYAISPEVIQNALCV